MDSKTYDISPKDSRIRQLGELHQVYIASLIELTETSNLHFTSTFSRLAYLVSNNLWTRKISFLLHTFRRAHKLTHSYHIDNLLELGKWAILFLDNKNHARREIDRLYEIFRVESSVKLRFEGLIAVSLIEILIEDKRFIAQRVKEPFDKIIVTYGHPDRNEDFTSVIEQLYQMDVLPIGVLLHEVEIDEKGLHSPNKIILDPDYLYGVTSISECFTPFGNHELGYLLRQIFPHKSSLALIIGNVANHFLDRLIYDPEITYERILPEIFSLDMLGLTLLSDPDIRYLLEQCKLHFEHLKKVVNIDLARQGLDLKSTYVEPSFYAVRYGIQGRLDLFYKYNDQASIVELKSGNPFKVNAYGLNSNHYHQTLLYDMLIEAVYGYRTNRKNFILYSKENNQALRFAPTLKVQQRETILQRNRLYLLDRTLEQHGDIYILLEQLRTKSMSSIKGYTLTELNKAIDVLGELDRIENDYVKELFKHLSRERYISKIGDGQIGQSKGLSSLWTDTVTEKAEQFNIINHLEIEHNYCAELDPLLFLKFSCKTIELNNFRVGDLCILYADQGGHADILSEQVFKSTIVQLGLSDVVLRLRSRQKNQNIFSAYSFWHVEHDKLDNHFTAMSRSIFEFVTHPKRYRDLILQRTHPIMASSRSSYLEPTQKLTEEQYQICNDIINAPQYYLLWGPPGTGKTSVMLRYLTDYYTKHTHQRIMLLAYTNRAVDEICSSISAIGDDIDFIRVGSRYSTHIDYRSHLLSSRLSTCKSRSEVRTMLTEQFLYVGTIASVLGKPNLFELVSFDLIIIDEASQVLDAQLLGLLGRCKKFVLIGDHKQLPAVTHQSIQKSSVESQALQALGFRSLANSLFERMYKHAVDNGWDHIYGQLSYQGRMHQELMQFVNHEFYGHSLSVLSGMDRLIRPLPSTDHVIRSNRLLYVNSDADLDGSSMKINNHEARACYHIIKSLLSKGDIDGEHWSMGIITPYRAQIACIRQLIEQIDHPLIGQVSIDTVERYQGSARDIVILSTCLNYQFQMNSLQSLSEDGMDRKLNVAFTRAKEQFILIGNKVLLQHSKSYRELISRSVELDQEILFNS